VIGGVMILVGVLLVLAGVGRMSLDMGWDRPKPSRLATFLVFAALGAGVALVVGGMALSGQLG
jgi:hypothetical protein